MKNGQYFELYNKRTLGYNIIESESIKSLK